MSSPKSELILKRILIAVDGSENATRAVHVASEIAKNSKAELTVLHVMTIPVSVYAGDMPVPLDKIEQDARSEGEKYVAAALSIATEKGIKAKTEIIQRIDSPVRGITEYAEKNAIDLIVVGTRGLGGFRRLLLGSVASGVVHYAHCSVLVVR